MGGLSVKVKKVNQWGLGTKFKGVGGSSVKVKKVNQWGLGTKFEGVGGLSEKVKKVNQWGLGTKSLKSARRVRKWVELARTVYTHRI